MLAPQTAANGTVLPAGQQPIQSLSYNSRRRVSATSPFRHRAGVGVGFAANPTSGGDGATDQLTLTAAPGMSGATVTLTASGVGVPAAGSGAPVSIPLIVAGYGYDAEVTGTPYEVEGGQLGREALRRRGWL